MSQLVPAAAVKHWLLEAFQLAARGRHAAALGCQASKLRTGHRRAPGGADDEEKSDESAAEDQLQGHPYGLW